MNKDDDVFITYFLVRIGDFNPEVCPHCGAGTVIRCSDKDTANRIVQTVNQSNMIFKVARLLNLIKTSFGMSLALLITGLILQRFIEYDTLILLTFAWISMFYGITYILFIAVFYLASYVKRKRVLKAEINNLIHETSTKGE